MQPTKTVSLLAAALLACCGVASAQTLGVSKDEIRIATIPDLSGPLAGYGKDIRNGMQLRVAEINEQGGVHGRKVTLLVEDAGYDPKRTVLAAQKLVNQDKVFAIVSTFGTAHANAAMPIMFAKNVLSLFPLSLSRDMYEPLHKYKYALIASYFDQMVAVVPKLYREKGAKKACAIYQDDDFGAEVLKGAEAGLQAVNARLEEKASFKRGATDFSSQVARLKAAGCDFIVMGTLIRESVGTIAEARKLQFNPVFVATSSAYTDLIPRLGGKAMDGFYAATTAAHPYLDDASQPLRFWANKYQTRFNEAPTTFSTYGYTMIDLFARAAQKAGPALTTDAFVKAMDSMGNIPGDLFGNPPMSFSATKHLASDASRLSQIQDGRWKVVYDYAQMK